MNLDELSEEIRKVSSEKIVQAISGLLVEWKGDDETVEDLVNRVERHLGNLWIERNRDHEKYLSNVVNIQGTDYFKKRRDDHK